MQDIYQAKELGSPNLFFRFENVTFNLVNCPYSLNISLVDTAIQVQSTDWVQEPVHSPDKTFYSIVPQDNNLEKLYKFYIRFHVWVNAIKWYGPFELDIGCWDSQLIFEGSSPEFTYLVGINATTLKMNITVPDIKATNKTYCFPRKFELINMVADPPAMTPTLIDFYPGCA